MYDVLQRKSLFTRKPIWDKKDLRGVTRRFVFFVPNHGPGAVRRPVLGCHTLEGSKPLRQFVEVLQIGQRGDPHQAALVPRLRRVPHAL